MSRVLGFHDYIDRYETTNRVINHVTDPGMSEILGVMYDLMKKKDADPKKEEVKKAALTQINDNNQKLVIQSSKVSTQEMLKGITEEAMQRMVEAALANAKNKPAEDKDALDKDGHMRAVEGVLADKIY
jgi:hypothetical protein